MRGTRPLRSAERALELDRYDPFGNFAYGRSFWLDGEVERNLDWLRQATEISPSFARGRYASGFAALMVGVPSDSRGAADRAARLSPLDPLGYGFLGVRAFADLAEGRHAEAARLADRAANAPGALVVMDLLAAAAHDLAGNADGASRDVVLRIRMTVSASRESVAIP